MIPVALIGFTVPAILCSGFTISIFAVMPKAALVGLLLSDLLHLTFQGPWQKESKRERVGDEEMGSFPDADVSEKSISIATEDVLTDVPRMEATVQQHPVFSI
jgi:hypothetical protein